MLDDAAAKASLYASLDDATPEPNVDPTKEFLERYLFVHSMLAPMHDILCHLGKLRQAYDTLPKADDNDEHSVASRIVMATLNLKSLLSQMESIRVRETYELLCEQETPVFLMIRNFVDHNTPVIITPDGGP